MKYKLFPSYERGYADYGWLKTHYSFSFANWYHPEKIHFGMLRVLNDDIIAPHAGFDFHPHQDMEIITIILQGELTHQDSMGNKGTIKEGEVQVMSAGTGILHSEKNESDQTTQLFQIWILPDKKGYTPRYAQKKFSYIKNNFQMLVSPNKELNSCLWVHQNAFMHRGSFDAQQNINYMLQYKQNGIYLMLINGKVQINDDIILNSRDAIGLWGTSEVSIQVKDASDILVIEVPMN